MDSRVFFSEFLHFFSTQFPQSSHEFHEGRRRSRGIASDIETRLTEELAILRVSRILHTEWFRTLDSSPVPWTSGRPQRELHWRKTWNRGIWNYYLKTVCPIAMVNSCILLTSPIQEQWICWRTVSRCLLRHRMWLRVRRQRQWSESSNPYNSSSSSNVCHKYEVAHNFALE